VKENTSKGIKFAEGTGSWTVSSSVTISSPDLDFIPDIIICHFESLTQTRYYYGNHTAENTTSYRTYITNTSPLINTYNSASKLYISDIELGSFKLKMNSLNENNSYGNYWYISGKCIGWYAIGLDEKDTALRDLLASILIEEGVSVTDEDNMISLIRKVDEEFNDKNNEIGDMKQGLIDTLTSKGLNVDDNLSFNELLDLVNVQMPPTLVLYDNGYVNTEIVGSFTRAYEGIFSGSTVMEMNEDHINVNVKVNASSSNAAKRIWGGIYSELAINTSKYRALHVEYSRGNSTGSLSVGMDANKQISADSKTSVNYTAGAPVTELNTKYIATCTFTPGNFYFLAFIYVGYVNVTCNFKIHRIWLDSIID
jgi:hypothetical protein